MSIDTYFCFCCLSTNDLSCLYSNDPNTNYADLLKTLFSITISVEDYEYDSHICKDCAQILKDINKFKTQVCKIINVLQSNGLIEITCENNQLNIKKPTSENALSKEDKYSIVLYRDTSQDSIPKSKTIKLEQDHSEDNKNRLTASQINHLEESALNTEIKILKDVTFSKEESSSRQNVSSTKNLVNDGSVEAIVKEHVTQYEVTEDLKCNICATALPNLYMYHAHMNQHYPNHICESCGKGFLTEKRLKRHMPSHRTGLFKCQWCDAEFSNYNTLNSHRQRKHSSIALYACPYCPSRFSTFTRRALHLATTHHRRSGHACRLCDRRFLIAGNLSAHMRNKHLKSKRHVCPTCGAAFQQRQELAAHESAHTGQRAFHCDLCPKKYPRKKALIVHMRTHTDEKRFACEECGKRFIQKCTLLVHAKTHNRTDKTADGTNLNVNTSVQAENVEFTFVRWNS